MARGGVANLIFTQRATSANAAVSDQIQETVSGVQTEVAVVQTDVGNVQTEVAEVQTEVDVVQNDVAVVQTEVANIESPISALKYALTDSEVATFQTLKDALAGRPLRVNLPIWTHWCYPMINEDGTQNFNHLSGVGVEFMSILSQLSDIEVALSLGPAPGWNGFDTSSILQGQYDATGYNSSDLITAWNATILRRQNNQHVTGSVQNATPDYSSVLYNTNSSKDTLGLVETILGLSHAELKTRIQQDINNNVIPSENQVDALALHDNIDNFSTSTVMQPQSANFVALLLYGYKLATCSCAPLDDFIIAAGLLGITIAKDSNYLIFFQTEEEKLANGDNGNASQRNFNTQWYEEVIKSENTIAICPNTSVCGSYIAGVFSTPTDDPSITLAQKAEIKFVGQVFTDANEQCIYVPSNHPLKNELYNAIKILEDYKLMNYVVTKHRITSQNFQDIHSSEDPSIYGTNSALAASRFSQVQSGLVLSYPGRDPADSGSNVPIPDVLTPENITSVYNLYSTPVLTPQEPYPILSSVTKDIGVICDTKVNDAVKLSGETTTTFNVINADGTSIAQFSNYPNVYSGVPVLIAQADKQIGEVKTDVSKVQTDVGSLSDFTVKDIRNFFTINQLQEADLSGVTFTLGMETAYVDQRFIRDGKLAGTNIVLMHLMNQITGGQARVGQRRFTIPDGYDRAGEEQSVLTIPMEEIGTGDDSTKSPVNREPDSPLGYYDMTGLLVENDDRKTHYGDFVPMLSFTGASFGAFTSSPATQVTISTLFNPVKSNIENLSAFFAAGLTLVMEPGHQILGTVTNALGNDANIRTIPVGTGVQDVVLGENEFLLNKQYSPADFVNQPMYEVPAIYIQDGRLGFYVNRNSLHNAKIRKGLELLQVVSHTVCWAHASIGYIIEHDEQSLIVSSGDFLENIDITPDNMSIKDVDFSAYHPGAKQLSGGAQSSDVLYHFQDGINKNLNESFAFVPSTVSGNSHTFGKVTRAQKHSYQSVCKEITADLKNIVVKETLGEQDLKVESSLGNGDNPAKKALELRGIYPMFNHPADAISYGAGNKCRPLYLDVTNNDGSITSKREFFVPSTPELIKGHHDSLKVPIELQFAPTDVAGALSENPADYPLQSFDDMFLTDTASGVSEPVQTQIKSLDKVAIIPSRFLGLYDCAADLGEWTEPGVLGYRLHITESHVYISKFSHPTERSISYLVGHTACDAIHKSVLIHNKKQNVLVTTEPAGLHNGGRGAKFNRLLTSILGTNGQTYIVNKLQADAGMTLEDATEAYDSFKAHIEATTQPEYQSESVDARKPFEVFDGGALFNPVMSYLNGLLLSDQVFRTFVFDFEQAEVQMFEQSNVIDEVTYTPPIQAVIDVLLEDSPIRVEFDGTKQKCESRIRTKRFPRGSKLTMKLQPRTNNPNAAQTEESERENASEVYAGQSNLFLSWKRHEAAVTYFTAMAAAADPGDYKTYLSERVVDQRAIADAIKLQYSIVESVPEPGAPPPQVNFLVGNTVDLMGVGVENGKVVSGYHYLSDRIVSRPPVASGLTSPYLVASRNELKDSFESSIRAVFTKAELAKFEALRAKDITLTSSEYTYPLANKMSWTWRGTHGKFSGFCIQVALMLSELTGVKIQFDYTGLDGTGYPPQGYGLFGDPKADVGLFWVSTAERRKLGTAISIRKDLPENVKVMTHVNNIAALTTDLLDPTLDTLAQFLHLDGLGYTLVKPPDGEFSPFEDIEVWLADPTNTPQNPPIIITGEQFNQGTYTLNPHEYVFYKVLPAFPNGAESTRFYSLQVSDISIFIKNGIPHHADIVECFEIIMKTGLTNSLAYTTSYQDAALEEDGLIPDEAARSWLTVPDTVGLSDATYTPVVLSKDNVLRDVASMRGLVNRLANDPPETDELSWFQNYKNYGGYVDPTAPVYYKNVRGLVCGLNDDETSDFVYKIYSTQAYNKLIQSLNAESAFSLVLDELDPLAYIRDRLYTIRAAGVMKIAMVAALFSDQANNVLGSQYGFKGVTYSEDGTVSGLTGYYADQARAAAFVIFNGVADYESKIVPISTKPDDRYEFVMDGRADFAEHMTTIKISREQSNVGARNLAFTDPYLIDGQKILVDTTLPVVLTGASGMGDFFQHAFTQTTFVICGLDSCNRNAARQLQQSSMDAGLTVTFQQCQDALLGVASPVHPWNPSNKTILVNDLDSALCYARFVATPINSRAYIADTTALAGKIFAPPAGTTLKMFPDSPISREPMSAFVPGNSPRLLWCINWTQRALIMAQYYGFTSSNIATRINDADIDTIERDFFINNSSMEEIIGSGDIFFRLIQELGNYEEMWDRSLTPVGVTRSGQNLTSEEGGALLVHTVSQI